MGFFRIFAGADGEISGEERQLIEVLARDVGIGQVSLDAMIDRAATDPDYYKEQFGFLNGDPHESLKLLFGVALIDGKLTDDERNTLKILADRLGITSDVYERMMDGAQEYVGRM